ncbi:MAG: hypothetical protein DMF61_00385 [Blastocatellia bacterium AA13]|nr:MAG: hypothetical protein DMF61_00385 [Blastocatellia bacterium AA13]
MLTQQRVKLTPSKRKLGALACCILISNLLVVYGGGSKLRLTGPRTLPLAAGKTIERHNAPVLSNSGKWGFVSTADGSLMAFSVTTGKLVSTVVLGQSAGPVSLVETESKRFVAAASPNDPEKGFPAVVSILDATSPKRMSISAVVALPLNENITTGTRVFMTRDARFGVIASSFGNPELMSFDLETGAIISTLPLLGRPSQVALYDEPPLRMIAITSAVANSMTIIKLGSAGQLEFGSSFNPGDGVFAEANNPGFSSDGRSVYAADSSGTLYKIRSVDGNQSAHLSIGGSPQQISVVGEGADDLIAVTKIKRPAAEKPSGVSIIRADQNGLALQSEFNPPSPIEFSSANNVLIHQSARTAFVGSETGVLFAFNIDTGEMDSYQNVGHELMSAAMTTRGRAVAVVRRGPDGDEVVVLGYDGSVNESENNSPTNAPMIHSLSPEVVEQGRSNSLSLMVAGDNFGQGSSLVVNGVSLDGVRLPRNGRAISTRLSKSVFAESGSLSVVVRNADGIESAPVFLRVARPSDPLIERLSPAEIGGPRRPFTLNVFGRNYRASSVISIGGTRLTTERVSDRILRAQVDGELVTSIRDLNVRVEDIGISDLRSNEKTLTVFGPRVDTLTASVENVVAGGRTFTLNISGRNFRYPVQVKINGETVPASLIRRPTRSLIRAVVRPRFFQEAARLEVVVKNPDGTASDPKTLSALPPEIAVFDPQELVAGDKTASMKIRGANFLKQARVFVSDAANNAFEVGRERVHFRSSSLLVVSFKEGDQLSQIIAQAGPLRVQVVNPNEGDGVPSEVKELKVSGPEISRVESRASETDETVTQLTISGRNFRSGAIVEFVKDGDVVRQQSPELKGSDLLIAELKKKKVKSLGSFSIRVVNPSNIVSNLAAVDH